VLSNLPLARAASRHHSFFFQKYSSLHPLASTIRVKASNEIIVSTGVIATPQLLLLSGIGDKNDLSKIGIKSVVDLPSVGRNLSGK
jgi:choline dehydrogenase-like flavoprotein